jgi:hypothetical protein
MEKYINFEISRNRVGEIFIRTVSKYADAEYKEIQACSYNMYDKMERLADKYNNHPAGCIGVTFTIG